MTECILYSLILLIFTKWKLLTFLQSQVKTLVLLHPPIVTLLASWLEIFKNI